MIEGLLGEGGMGAVYAARDGVIDRRVALKILHLPTQKASARFRAEAAAASRISSRFVSAVHDYGRDEALGCEYLVMELLDGRPLDAVLRAEGALSATQAAAIGADIAEALAAAHAAGVIHRDLKPGNVFVLADGGVKVIDFGIARLAAPDGPRRAEDTHHDVILGTPAYISPEAVQGGVDVGPGADLYALGVILFELVAGRPPFHDPVASALCAMHLRMAPPALAEVRPDAVLPEAFERLVSALLEKDPADRPRAADEVAGILRSLGGDTTSLRLAGLADPEAGARTSTVSRTRPVRSRRAPLLAAIGVALLAIALLAVVVLVLFRGEPPTPPVSEARTPRAPVTAPPPPAPPEPAIAAPRVVEVPVALVPAAATLTLDGAPVASPLTLPDDDSEHALIASAPGYLDEARAVRGARDRAIAITLRRAPRRRALPARLREW